MDKIAVYGGILTVGVGFTTSAAASVGNPIPVVAPAMTAAGVAGAEYVRQKQADRDGEEQPGEGEQEVPIDEQADAGDALDDLDLDGGRVVVIEEEA